MATTKDYLCKDCENNNNGWCLIQKRNGLKEIAYCNHKIPKGFEIAKVIDNQNDDILSKANLSKQKEKEQDLNDLKKLLKENLTISLESSVGLIPGSKDIKISLNFKDEEISKVSFNVK